MNNSEKKKRGRHKKDLQLKNESIQNELATQENIQLVTEESIKESTTNDNILKKRGRKPKGGKLVIKQIEPVSKSSTSSNVILHLKCSLNDLNNYNIEKKKLLSDPLDYDPTVPPEIMTYNESNTFFMYKNGDQPIIQNEYISENQSNQYAYYDSSMKTSGNIICKICNTKIRIDENEQDNTKPNLLEKEGESFLKISQNTYINSSINSSINSCIDNYNYEDNDDDINIKDINSKLKNLKINLYKNSLHDKKSACFWCTYEYDNQSCYIPKYEVDEKIYGYGSFCRPECAVAYLMKENIDDSQKFERYHLLNQIYSKVYNFKKSIKPAPNPYYLLDKFYGNLTIQEYRKLLKTEHMLLVIDKPMTRILPELHEDNESMMLNIYGGAKTASTTTGNTNGVYKVKRQSEKQQGPTKTSIIRDKFGLT